MLAILSVVLALPLEGSYSPPTIPFAAEPSLCCCYLCSSQILGVFLQTKKCYASCASIQWFNDLAGVFALQFAPLWILNAMVWPSETNFPVSTKTVPYFIISHQFISPYLKPNSPGTIICDWKMFYAIFGTPSCFGAFGFPALRPTATMSFHSRTSAVTMYLDMSHSYEEIQTRNPECKKQVKSPSEKRSGGQGLDATTNKGKGLQQKLPAKPPYCWHRCAPPMLVYRISGDVGHNELDVALHVRCIWCTFNCKMCIPEAASASIVNILGPKFVHVQNTCTQTLVITAHNSSGFSV
ncbi:hypothetical protein B0H17DRAFT_1147783 [Mycena rosella]|uniref:Secreted protein n=1 Tax=Mycena rosella TaxID=1033263 RepID=A0AAD7FXX8_MYCRO|nr:hypothetical protein B0H17DRAFT_1147783 [Mycena rosella]